GGRRRWIRRRGRSGRSYCRAERSSSPCALLRIKRGDQMAARSSGVGCEGGAGSRSRILVETAPVDGLGAEVEAALDLDAVDVEAVARLDIGTLLAFEISVLDRVDLVRAGRQVPGRLARGVEPGL